MGQTLSSPATDKSSESGGNDRFFYSVSEMQGWRITMEDAHTIILNLDENKEDTNTFFAVYDGHGGSTVARYAGKNVHKRLVSEEEYRQKNYPLALQKAFLGTDEDMLADPSYTRDPSGSTAIVTLITADNKIYAANAGDSRSIMSVKGEAKPLSYDHKPQNQVEKNRIVAAGGYIEYGRVNGNLALARAFGDFAFKKNYTLTPEKQIITCDPEVIEHQITEEDEFIVLACDGIWDCLTSQGVINIIRLQVSEGKELSEIGEFICDHCLAPNTQEGTGVGCDNMTIMIVAITHGRTKEQWYEWIKDRVEQNYGFETPKTIPQIWPNTYRNWKQPPEQDRSSLFAGVSPFAGRLIQGPRGFSYNPGAGSFNGSGLMFDHDDSDDSDGDSDDDFLMPPGPFQSQTFGQGSASNKSLREQLADLDGREEEHDVNGDMNMSGLEEIESHAPPKTNGDADATESMLEDADLDAPTEKSVSSASSLQPPSQGEAPPPPKSLPNGDSVRTPDQFESHPAGDEPSTAVRAEGLMDSSESPLKV